MSRSHGVLISAMLVAAAFATAASESRVATAPGSSEQSVEARSRAWFKAAVDADADAFRTFATDDYVMLYIDPATAEHPARWATMSLDEWVSSIRAGSVKYRSVEIRNTKVRVNGDIATLSGEYTQTAVRDGREATESGLFVETWVRRRGQWFAVSDVFP